MLFKLVIIAFVCFVFFGASLLFTLWRKKKRKESCAHVEGEERCHSCSCDRFK